MWRIILRGESLALHNSVLQHLHSHNNDIREIDSYPYFSDSCDTLKGEYEHPLQKKPVCNKSKVANN